MWLASAGYTLAVVIISVHRMISAHVIAACPIQYIELRPELILAIATVILAFVTAWMACETRRTATAAIKALEFEQMPILGLRDLKIDVGKWQPGQLATLTSIRIGIELFNSRRVPVRHKPKSLSVTLANQGVTSGEFESGGGRILPGASTVFWRPALSLNPPVSNFPANGRIRFEYDYSDEFGSQSQSITDVVEYTVFRGDDGSYMSNWWTVDQLSSS